MKQLTIGDVLGLVKMLISEAGMTLEEVKELPIYLSDDDELNGIHCGWEARLINADDEEDEYYVDMINENRGNYKLTCNDSAILIC